MHSYVLHSKKSGKFGERRPEESNQLQSVGGHQPCSSQNPLNNTAADMKTAKRKMQIQKHTFSHRSISRFRRTGTPTSTPAQVKGNFLVNQN